MDISLTKKYWRGEVGPIIGCHPDPDVITLTPDEFLVVLGVQKKRDKANKNVTCQAVSDDCRELESLVAEFCAAKFFNVFPDIQWSEYKTVDLMVGNQPVDVKLHKYGINIRWNNRHANAPFNTVYVGVEPLHINQCKMVGAIRKQDLKPRFRKTGKDGVDYFSVPTNDLKYGLSRIINTTPQWQTNEHWISQYNGLD